MNCSGRPCRNTPLLPAMSSSCICIAALYAPALSDEDQEIDPDRWCSHWAWGQEAWQIVSQWTWNLRLELGHRLEPTPVRITEFAPAIPEHRKQAATLPPSSTPASGYGPPTRATSWKVGRFTGADFSLQPDGTLQCPAGQSLSAHERRQEADGSLRIVYGASPQLSSLSAARAVSMECRRHGKTTPGQRVAAPAPAWFCPAAATRDWSRREHRRACMQLIRQQRVEVNFLPPSQASPAPAEVILSRAQRAHTRLSWEMRLARNARSTEAGQVNISLFGVPETFAEAVGLSTRS
jgi:hypothetical protein